MFISCKCLNIVLSAAGLEQQTNARSSENSTTNNPLLALIETNPNKAELFFKELQKNSQTNKIYSECLDFLKQATFPVQELAIAVQQDVLVYKIPIDQWFLHYCINCNKITHATSSISTLINPNLLTNYEELNRLKSNKSYSSTFKILMIDHTPTTPSGAFDLQQQQQTEMFNFQQSGANPETNRQQRLKHLNQTLQQCLQKEIDETNQKIRRYTEQQFSLLKSFREKSEQEYQILMNLINQVPDELKIDAIDGAKDKAEAQTSAIVDQQQNSLFTLRQLSNLDTPPQTPESQPMSIGSSPTFRQNQSQNNMFHGRQNNSCNEDGDCLFDFDDTLDNSKASNRGQLNNMSDVEEAEDAEDALGDLDSGGITFQKYSTRRASLNLAKSLPISISNQPMTKSRDNKKINYQYLEEEAPEDSTIDIAASIKALAKSVHGEPIFGDLPRPRFSTQI